MSFQGFLLKNLEFDGSLIELIQYHTIYSKSPFCICQSYLAYQTL